MTRGGTLFLDHDFLHRAEDHMTNNAQTKTGTRRARWTRPLLAITLGVLACGGLNACKRSALRPDDERTQFSRYDRTRNADSAPFIEDEFGRRTPNLRARLLVQD